MNADAFQCKQECTAASLCGSDWSKQTNMPMTCQMNGFPFRCTALYRELCALMSKNSAAKTISSHFYFHRHSVPFSACTLLPFRERGVHFRVVQLVRKQLSTVVLNISALFTRMAMTAKRRRLRSAINCYSDKRFSNNGHPTTGLAFDDNTCTTKLEFNEAYSKSQLSIFSGF